MYNGGIVGEWNKTFGIQEHKGRGEERGRGDNANGRVGQEYVGSCGGKE